MTIFILQMAIYELEECIDIDKMVACFDLAYDILFYMKQIFIALSSNLHSDMDVFFQIASEIRRRSEGEYVDEWYNLEAWIKITQESLFKCFNKITKYCIDYILEFEIYKTEENTDDLIDYLIDILERYDIIDTYIVIKALLYYNTYKINEKLNEILFSDEIEIRLEEILNDENDERIHEIESILKEISNED